MEPMNLALGILRQLQSSIINNSKEWTIRRGFPVSARIFELKSEKRRNVPYYKPADRTS
jgi:hypothetical protein